MLDSKPNNQFFTGYSNSLAKVCCPVSSKELVFYMIIKLNNIEIFIKGNLICFAWQDENDLYQQFELSLTELKKAIKFLEDNNKQP
jgi:hypothetical protein